MDSQQHGTQGDTMCLATCRVESICGCNVGDKGDHNNTANITSSSVNVDTAETEHIGTVSSVVRTYDTDVCHIRAELMIWINPKLLIKHLFY